MGYYETRVVWHDDDDDMIVASEACGGVVESNLSLGSDKYIATNLLDYIESLIKRNKAGSFSVHTDYKR